MQLEPAVRVLARYDTRNLDHVGYKAGPNNLYFGAYGFSTPYSANMFAYLYRKYDYILAASTVTLFEKQLSRSSIRKFGALVSVNWGDVISLNWTKAIDWESTVRDVAVAAAGRLFNLERAAGVLAELNPYSAQADQEEYVDYAILYWSRHFTQGPAYRIIKV